MTKMKELRNFSKEELLKKASEVKQELLKERATISSGTKVEKPSKIKNLRKDIARILTIINEKEVKINNARN
jgi:large subunit ribosomal protein L29